MSCFAGMLEAFVSCLKTYAMYLKSVQENPATPEPEQEQQKFGIFFTFFANSLGNPLLFGVS
jgi:hypothetical protein